MLEVLLSRFRYLVLKFLLKLSDFFGLNIQKHLSNPGEGVGKFLVSNFVFKNNNKSNQTLLQRIFQNESHFLKKENLSAIEFGFGNGDTLQFLLQLMQPNKNNIAYGYEISKSMVDETQAKLQEEINKGCLKLQLIQDKEETALPHKDNSVDLVYHANVIYFVKDPKAFLKENYRVLKHGTGVLGMCLILPNFFPSSQQDSPFINKWLPEDFMTCLKEEIGFREVKIEMFDTARFFVIATK